MNVIPLAKVHGIAITVSSTGGNVMKRNEMKEFIHL
jgi:hypothetical protein